MQCNIDAKGKALRLISGAVCALIGVVLAGLTVASVINAWVISALLLVSGAFMIFEGWNGWCVLRAMGIKTKI